MIKQKKKLISWFVYYILPVKDKNASNNNKKLTLQIEFLGGIVWNCFNVKITDSHCKIQSFQKVSNSTKKSSTFTRSFLSFMLLNIVDNVSLNDFRVKVFLLLTLTFWV
jgi:hypothetical protein